MGFHEERQRQLVLAFVVTLKGTLRDASLFRDFARCGRVHALMDEQL